MGGKVGESSPHREVSRAELEKLELELRSKQVARGQYLGFASLVTMLTAVIVLSIINQPWVAGVVGGGSLVAVIVVFVTGKFEPRSMPRIASPAAFLAADQAPPQ